MSSLRQIVREPRGFAPFPEVIICWDQVGVSAEINTPSTSRAREDGKSLLALDFSFFAEFFHLSNRMLAHLRCKGKSSQLGFSTDFVILCVALLPLKIISQASRIWGHHSSSYTADPSLHLQPCLDDTPFPDRSFCSLYFTCMQPNTERGKGGKKDLWKYLSSSLFP